MFIALEGIDGCGKTTVCNELLKHYPNAHFVSRRHYYKKLNHALKRNSLETLNHLIWGSNDETREMFCPEYWLHLLISWHTELVKFIKDSPSELIFIDGWIYRNIIKTSLMSYSATPPIALKYFNLIEGLASPSAIIQLDIDAEMAWHRRDGKFEPHECGHRTPFYNPAKPEESFIYYQNKIRESYILLSQKIENWYVVPSNEKLEAVVENIIEKIENIRLYSKNFQQTIPAS